jgi:hypothetical protein
MIAADLISQARISDVWGALGGPSLRSHRGPAWWRDGDGYNVALNDSKATWFDHARGEGGGVLDLVQAVRGCRRAEALAWLADYLGVQLSQPTSGMRSQWKRQRQDMRAAELWARAATALAEASLEEVDSCDPRRLGMTRIMQITRAGSLALLEEFREWQSADPELTAAMLKAGEASQRRLHRGLAALIAGWGSIDAAA